MTNEIIIDAENAVLGRLASYVVKEALSGKKIVILNSEKAIILGNRQSIIEKYLRKRSYGGGNINGPFFSSIPEKILRRTIRGMLPYKKERGLLAFKRVLCYSGIPEKFNGKKMIKAGRGKTGMSLKEISKMLRGGVNG